MHRVRRGNVNGSDDKVRRAMPVLLSLPFAIAMWRGERPPGAALKTRPRDGLAAIGSAAGADPPAGGEPQNVATLERRRQVARRGNRPKNY